MPRHTLYYAPGTCALSPAIAMHEAGIPFDRVRVDLRAKKLPDGSDYLAVMPKGYVPALRLPDGQLLTEGAVMVQYIADQKVERQLAPLAGSFERYRLEEWLNFIATELHKGVSPLYNPAANDEFKASLLQRLRARLGVLADALRTQPYLMGDRFTVADGYAFYALRTWQHTLKQDLSAWPLLVDYYARIAARPTVQRALEEEGLKA